MFLLRDIVIWKDIFWLIVGDFNTVFKFKDRVGGVFIYWNEIEDFRWCIEECRLDELKVICCYFIWNNKYEKG